jgi:TPR repeat protein
VSRGDALLGVGDLTSARLFYRRGADLGDGTAALRLGETFDPAFLQQAGLSGVAGDPKMALHWYRRARDLGNGDADLLLQHSNSADGKKQ